MSRTEESTTQHPEGDLPTARPDRAGGAGAPTAGVRRTDPAPCTARPAMTRVALLVYFLLVCVAELVAGWLLWRRQRAGALLALVLLPFRIRVLDRLRA